MRYTKGVLRSIFCILIAVVYASGCKATQEEDTQTLYSMDDLRGMKLTIHNTTCSEYWERRTVEDNTFIEEILESCDQTEQFRPITSVDVILGNEEDLYNAYFTFEDETQWVQFSFVAVKEQLDLGFVHRERPVIAVSGGTVKYDSEWTWYCIMPAADYAALYEQVQMYSDGEIIR